jgi:transposase
MRVTDRHATASGVRALQARKPSKVAAVALANKTVRIVWAVMMRADGYRPKEVLGQPA